MSAGKHTPGPWKVITEQAANEVDVFEVAEVSHFRIIPNRPNTWETQGDAFADARLIAAAPALLEALQSAMKTAEFERHPFRPWHDEAHAAIALATGEGHEQ